MSWDLVGDDERREYEERRGEAAMREHAQMNRSPRQRWGTCCPYDPECEHSFLDIDALIRHMDTPISEAQANLVAGR